METIILRFYVKLWKFNVYLPIQPDFSVFPNSPRRVRETRPGAVETWEQVGCAVLHMIVGRFGGNKDWKECYMDLLKWVFDATVSFTSRMCPCICT